MPHMLAEEHMGYVVIDPNLPRNNTTWANAISTIGATPKMLILTLAGDGVWSLTSSLSSPANIITFIPPGVTVNVATGVTLTLNGPLVSYNPNWKTGTGTVQRGSTTPVEISALTGMNIKINFDGEGIRLTSPTTSSYISLTTFQGTSVPAVQFIRTAGTDANNWEIQNGLSNWEWIVARPNGLPHLAMNNTGLWVSNGAAYTSPAHLLHLQLDDAFKPNDGSWDFPSDEQLKTVQRVVAEGLAELQAMPEPVWFRWNGKGGTDASAPEQMGWIAQETVGVMPYLFKTYADKLDPADAETTTLYSANYSPLIPLLVNAVRQLAARVEALETVTGTRVPDLEAAAHTHGGGGSAASTIPFVPRPFSTEDATEPESRRAPHQAHHASPKKRRG